MDQHVRHDLSAYLDDALPPERAGAVRLHVAECRSCRSDLAELREAARLLAALPAVAPTRRLVPSLAPRFNWLRPLRSLSAVGAATFLFLFMASATLDSGFRMGGGARPMSGPAGMPAAGAPAPGGAAGESTALQASPTAVPAALDAARTTTVATSTPGEQKSFAVTASPAARQEGARSGAGGDAEMPPNAPDALHGNAQPPQIGPTPWLWLALMLISAAIALVAHRRLRTR